MDQFVTTIIIGPSGTGKTTRVEKMREEDGLQFAHISRDKILGDLLHENSMDLRRHLTEQDRERIGHLMSIREFRYREALGEAFTAEMPHVVIDYPPGEGEGKWISDTITLSKKVGRKIVIEGLFTEPTVTLARVLKRDSRGLDLSTQKLEMMNPDGKYFISWLRTYKNFPEQFLKAAQVADEAYLYNAEPLTPTLVANWYEGQPRVNDIMAFETFNGLDNINLETARFDVKAATAQKQNDVPVHTFEVSTSGFYGLHYPENPTAPTNKAIVTAGTSTRHTS